MNLSTATRDLKQESDAALVWALLPSQNEALQHEAVAELHRRHAGFLRSAARRLLWSSDLADEAVQDAFLDLWLAPERFDPERGSLRAYLQVQAQRRAVDLARSETSRRRREQGDAQRVPAPAAGLEERFLDRSAARELRRAVGRLDPKEREAIELAYFAGHSYRRVAVMLGQPEGTVKNRIRAGLRRLRGEKGIAAGALRSPIRGREQSHS